jgi:hypothetical protein
VILGTTTFAIADAIAEAHVSPPMEVFAAVRWLRMTPPEVPVSLNISFHYLEAITADVYRANYWLRRLGLHPTPPRVSAFEDAIKRSVYGPVNRTVLQPAPAARRAIRAMKHPARKS